MIIFISRKYPPSVGGMQRMSYHLAQALSRQAEMAVIAWGGSQVFLPAFWAYALGQTARLRCRAALVHLTDALLSPLGVLTKTLLNIPVSATVHGLDLTFPLPPYQYLVAGCLRRLDRLICVSTPTREECLRRGLGANLGRVVPNGVDWSRWATPPPGARAALAKLLRRPLAEAKIVLSVGRLVRRKGIAWFIEEVLPPLAAMDSSVHYLIIGEGPERGRIAAAAQRQGLQEKVLLLGKVEESILDLAYAAADVLVVPNVPVAGDWEGFGLVALEGAAAGLPVVAARLEGLPEAVADGESGLLLSPQDRAAWVAALEALLRDEGRRRQLGARGQAFVRQNCSWEAAASRYLAEFEEIVGRPLRRPGVPR